MYVIIYENKIKAASDQPKLMPNGLYFDKLDAIKDTKALNNLSDKYNYFVYKLERVK